MDNKDKRIAELEIQIAILKDALKRLSMERNV
jgi:uncharacterized coiled-coil protein SlyX